VPKAQKKFAIYLKLNEKQVFFETYFGSPAKRRCSAEPNQLHCFDIFCTIGVNFLNSPKKIVFDHALALALAMKKYFTISLDRLILNELMMYISGLKIPHPMKRRDSDFFFTNEAMNPNKLVTIGDLREFKEDLLLSIGIIVQQKAPRTAKKWLKSHEVRKLLNVSGGTLQTLRNNGTLPSTKIVGLIFYDQDEIEKVMAGNKNPNFPKKGLLPYTRFKSDSRDEIRNHTVYQLVIVAVRRLLAGFLTGNKSERLEKPVGQIYGITYQVIASIWIPRRQIS